MYAKSVPLPAPEDLAMERLVAAVESAIDRIQERLANLADDGQNAKWSLSDLSGTTTRTSRNRRRNPTMHPQK